MEQYLNIISEIFKNNKEKQAVKFKEQSITYKELEEQTNRVCELFEKNNIVRQKVAICLPKDINHIISILGSMKSNNVFVPIDYKLPKERLENMFNSINIKIAVVDNETSEIVKKLNSNMILINIEKMNVSQGEIISENMIAEASYIFFTSGSTGTPKAIIGTYEGLYKFLIWEISELEINSDIKVSFISAIGFDPMLRDIFVPLLAGGTIIIPSTEELLDAEEFENWLVINKINLIHIVPTLFKYLFKEIVNKENLKNLKYIILAGELLRGKDIEFFYQRKLDVTTELINFYGPAETILAKFYYRISKKNINDNYVPVGKPIDNVNFKIINTKGKITNNAKMGEIVIEPNFKLLGYYNNDTMNKNSFINKRNTDSGYQEYKTGDFGYINKNNELIIIGRRDSQIKLNGVRIEISEIENILLCVNEIYDNRVILIDNNLVAFYTATKEIDKSKIINKLKTKLSKTMIPKEFIFLQEMPKNHSGKIDKIQLEKVYRNQEKLNNKKDTSTRLLEKTFGTSYCVDDVIDASTIDSLKYARLKNELKKLGVKISLIELMRIKTVMEMEKLFANSKNNDIEIKKSDNSIKNKCNEIQEKIYYASKLADNEVYNITKIIELPTELHLSKLFKSIKANVEKIDLFNSKFFEMKDGIYIKKEKSKFNIDKINYNNSFEESIHSWIKKFNLNNDFLYRIGMLEYSQKRYLIFNVHHLIADEYSLELLIKKIFQLYYYDKKPIYENYNEFLKWYYDETKLKNIENNKFIAEKLDGITNIELPYDNAPKKIREFEGKEIRFNILEKETIEKISETIQKLGITYYTLFNSVINIMLAKYSQNEDITVSSPVGMRFVEKFDNIFGPLINVIPVRNIINYDEELSKYLNRIAINNIDIIDYPLVDMSKIQFEDRSNNIDISYTFHDKRKFDEELKKFNLKEINLETKTAKFKLMFEIVLHKNSIEGRIEYDKYLFNKDTILRMSEHFKSCIEKIINIDIKTKIKDIEFLTKEEIKLYNELDNLSADYDKEVLVTDIFDRIVRKYPNKVAVVYEEKEITYNELDKKSNIIANYISKKGIINQTIGILSEKNIECVEIILGIIKSGNAYVPINITYPNERINYIINDLQTNMIITSSSLIGELELEIENLVAVEDVFDCENNTTSLNNIKRTQNDPLYIIYTSGTTGKPKGAIITHRNLVRLLFNSKFEFDFTESDTWTMFHSYCFDFSVWEMYGALLYGGKLILVNDFVARDPREYMNLLKKEKVTILNQTPSYFYKLLEEIKSSSEMLELRYVIFGGEALDIMKTKPFYEQYKNTKIINMYGITETTVHVTYKEITANDYKNSISNIGKPIPTLKIVLLDKNKKLQAIGVPGEIYVLGDGVCNGYVNNTELTKDRFSTLNAYNLPMYKSGDLAKLMPKGELVYMGRNDEQVKIRGFRIELSEIENAIRIIEPTINSMIVTTRKETENKNIVVYYTGTKVLQFRKIKKQLLTILPEYMIPAYIIHVDSIPLTINGKADKRKLNEIPILLEKNNEYIEPRNNLDLKISEIWKTILNVDKISIKDNFFEMGGDSFKALKASYLSEDLYSIQMLYENPTIETLSDTLATKNYYKRSKVYYYNEIINPDATIVMIPYAGGETIIYDKLTKEIMKHNENVNIAVVDANYLTNNFVEEINEIIKELIEKNNNKPFVIYTHCAGDGIGLYIGNKLKLQNQTISQVIIGASLPPIIKKNEYFETNYWKDSSDEDIIKFLEGLDNSVNYRELNKLDVFIGNFRRTVEIRRELLYFLKNNIIRNNRNDASLIFGLKDSYTSNYKVENENWNEYVKVKQIVTYEEGQHYFINTHFKEISDIITKYI